MHHIFDVLLVAVPASVAADRTYDLKLTRKGGYVILEQKWFEIYRVQGSVVRSGSQR